MSTSNAIFWKQEVDHRKRVRNWMIKVLSVLLGLLVLLWGLITQPLLGSLPVRSDLPKVDPSRLEIHVRKIVTDVFPRNEAYPRNLDRVASYIGREFLNAHGVTQEQTFEAKGKTYRNIIASFGPETPERIVVGAHYDAAGEKPGSDDNASGIAGLMELAYLLGRAKPGIRIDLVAYTLEEPPYFQTEFMGSAVHAKSLRTQRAAVRLMISLEMIGCFTDAPHSQALPSSFIKPFYPAQGNFIAVVGTLSQTRPVRRVKRAMTMASALPVYSMNAPVSLPGVGFSDQLNYWNQGYDAIMITDTAFYRNPRYHTDADTPDTLDYKRMAMVVQGVYAAVIEIAK